MRTIGQQLKQLGFASYADYLQSPHWLKVRRKWGFKKPVACPGCCEQSFLDLHHVTYQRLGKELSSDIIGLCRECHAAVHMELAILYQGQSLESQVEQTKVVFERVTGTSWADATSRWFVLRNGSQTTANARKNKHKHQKMGYGRPVGQRERAKMAGELKDARRGPQSSKPEKVRGILARKVSSIPLVVTISPRQRCVASPLQTRLQALRHS